MEVTANTSNILCNVYADEVKILALIEDMNSHDGFQKEMCGRYLKRGCISSIEVLSGKCL
jgi:hypothetical protein